MEHGAEPVKTQFKPNLFGQVRQAATELEFFFRCQPPYILTRTVKKCPYICAISMMAVLMWALSRIVSVI